MACLSLAGTLSAIHQQAILQLGLLSQERIRAVLAFIKYLEESGDKEGGGKIPRQPCLSSP